MIKIVSIPRYLNIVGFYFREWITRGRLPLPQKYIEGVDTEVERDLRRRGKIQTLLKKKISAVEELESRWIRFEKLWEELLEHYKVVGFIRDELTAYGEYAMSKWGSREIKEKELRAELAEDKAAAAEGKEGKVGEKKKIKQEENIMDIYVDKDFKNPIKTKYLTPAEIPFRTWNCLLNDKEDFVNEQTLSYFGYARADYWITYYRNIIEKICGEVKEKIIGKKILDEDEKKNFNENITMIQLAYPAYIEKFYNDVIAKLENDQYKYLRDDLSREHCMPLDNMATQFNNILPEGMEYIKVLFRHTYMIINPKTIIDPFVYQAKERGEKNVAIIAKITELLENLEKEIEKGDDELMTGLDIKTNKWKRWIKGVIRTIERFSEIRKKKPKQLSDSLKKIKLEHLQLILEALYMINNKVVPYPIPERITSDDIQMLEGERAPGMDEYGWPLEVSKTHKYEFMGESYEAKKGKDYRLVLLDIFEGRAEIREVHKSFVTEMDLLDKVVFVLNEFDAISDDLREGRYHPNSLTIIDYVMATAPRAISYRARMPKRFERKQELTDKEKEKIKEEIKDRLTGKTADQKDRILKREYKKRAASLGLMKEWVEMTENELVEKEEKYNKTKNPRDSPRFYEMRVYASKEEGDPSIPTWGLRKPSLLNPAFDRRAIEKERGEFWHLGKKRYYMPASTILELDKDAQGRDEWEKFKDYIGPTISSKGLSLYIMERVLWHVPSYKDAKNVLIRIAKEKAQKWYDLGARERGVPEKDDEKAYERYQNPLEIPLPKAKAETGAEEKT